MGKAVWLKHSGIGLTVVASLALELTLALSAPAATEHSSSNPKYCPKKAHVLDGVYHKSRLAVMRICQRASGTVSKVILEDDGDLHIRVHLTATYAGLTNDVNDAKQHGDLVVEFMPRDGGHLPRPHIGDRLTLVGAWVNDTEHGWNELHPVWRGIFSGTVYTSGPQNGGSPASDRSANAADDCRDRGQRCTGYGR